jgi:hypothetical protein
MKKMASIQAITASGQGEQKEIQRLAKNRIYHATSSARRVPKESERRPLRHHAGAGCSGNGERSGERDEAQDGLNRELHRSSADENRVTAWQIGEMRPLQGQEGAVQDEKCGRCKSREDSPLQAQRFPEYFPVAKRPEPEHVHVVRQRGPTAEEDARKDGENEKKSAETPRRMRPRMGRRPIN